MQGCHYLVVVGFEAVFDTFQSAVLLVDSGGKGIEILAERCDGRGMRHLRRSRHNPCEGLTVCSALGLQIVGPHVFRVLLAVRV